MLAQDRGSKSKKNNRCNNLQEVDRSEVRKILTEIEDACLPGVQRDKFIKVADVFGGATEKSNSVLGCLMRSSLRPHLFNAGLETQYAGRWREVRLLSHYTSISAEMLAMWYVQDARKQGKIARSCANTTFSAEAPQQQIEISSSNNNVITNKDLLAITKHIKKHKNTLQNLRRCRKQIRKLKGYYF
jgi:hypothetical protein